MSAMIGSSWIAATGAAPQIWSMSLADIQDATTHGATLRSLRQGRVAPRASAQFESALTRGGLGITSTDFRPPRIAVKSYFFTAAASEQKIPECPPPESPNSRSPDRARRYTRVSPPEDVIGLADRLSMLL